MPGSFFKPANEASMTQTELTELARAYVALFNSHRIDLVLSMFAAGANYESDAGSKYRGRAAIGDMMHVFFTDNPDVYWQASNFRCDDHRVSFDFSMNAGEGGDAIHREGIEHIDFTADGSIKKVTVELAS
jgi:hypothetical protein